MLYHLTHNSQQYRLFKQSLAHMVRFQTVIRVPYLIRAKVAAKKGIRLKRMMKGMKKCGENCTSCPYILKKKSDTFNQKSRNINRRLDCISCNLVNEIRCIKESCQKIYIGETNGQLKSGIANHRGYVLN